jgi:hypothetical protein
MKLMDQIAHLKPGEELKIEGSNGEGGRWHAIIRVGTPSLGRVFLTGKLLKEETNEQGSTQAVEAKRT